MQAGELLLEFDEEAIEKEGYKTITPVIVTNSDQYAAVELSLGSVTAKRDTLLTLAAQEEDA